jgi:spore coat protein SA
MNIALLCTEMLPVPPIMGGAIQIYIDGILPYLSKFHDITVFSVQKGGLPNTSCVDNVKYIRFQGNTEIEYIENVKNHIKDNNYNLIHVFNRPNWILELDKITSNTPLSLSLHNEMMIPDKISPSDALSCIDRVCFIITISEFIKNELVNMYPSAQNKVYPIYSAVDCNILKPIWSEEAFKNKLNLLNKYNLNNHKIILCVSRLSPDKGQYILLDAMKYVIKSYPNTALVLVGSKWYGEHDKNDYVLMLEDKASKLNCPVIFTGFLTPDEVIPYYNMADIFVCASQWREPLARIHYEAMAAGLPIITTNRGGNSEVISEYTNGLILDEYNNAEEMAKKIILLLENETLCTDMGKSARKIAEEEYNYRRLSNKLLKIFSYI